MLAHVAPPLLEAVWTRVRIIADRRDRTAMADEEEAEEEPSKLLTCVMLQQGVFELPLSHTAPSLASCVSCRKSRERNKVQLLKTEAPDGGISD